MYAPFWNYTSDSHGVSRIKKTLCTLHSDQGMFLNTQVSQMVQITAIPREMCVTIPKS